MNTDTQIIILCVLRGYIYIPLDWVTDKGYLLKTAESANMFLIVYALSQAKHG